MITDFPIKPVDSKEHKLIQSYLKRANRYFPVQNSSSEYFWEADFFNLSFSKYFITLNESERKELLSDCSVCAEDLDRCNVC